MGWVLLNLTNQIRCDCCGLGRARGKEYAPLRAMEMLGMAFGYWSPAVGLYQCLLAVIVPGFESKRQMHTVAVDGWAVGKNYCDFFR